MDIGRIAHESVGADSAAKNNGIIPADESKDKKKESVRNGLPDSLTGGTREM